MWHKAIKVEVLISLLTLFQFYSVVSRDSKVDNFAGFLFFFFVDYDKVWSSGRDYYYYYYLEFFTPPLADGLSLGSGWLVGWLVGWVYCISTFVGYLMPNQFLYK